MERERDTLTYIHKSYLDITLTTLCLSYGYTLVSKYAISLGVISLGNYQLIPCLSQFLMRIPITLSINISIQTLFSKLFLFLSSKIPHQYIWYILLNISEPIHSNLCILASECVMYVYYVKQKWKKFIIFFKHLLSFLLSLSFKILS